MSFDCIVIGSGIGGLCAGALLSRYGQRVLICESHTIPGGAAHGFTRQGFHFDSGPSFYCGLGDRLPSLNPLKLLLDQLGESLQTVPYDPLGHYHFPEGVFPVYCQQEAYHQAVAEITPQGARELQAFEQPLLDLYQHLQDIPLLGLRADWRSLPWLFSRRASTLLKLLPQLRLINSSAGQVMDRTIQDAWVRRLIDLECFLLSGLKAHGTVAPEIAFMLGERSRVGVEYPVGGSGAIVDALVRGLQRWGGQLRLGCHVSRIRVQKGQVQGVTLRSGEEIKAPIVISNASLWDTYGQLLAPEDLPQSFRQQALQTPAVESFMHLHLGIRAEGLADLTGHHVVVHEAVKDIAEPGNTCMISIPSVWDPNLAPPGHHVLHAYTLEPFTGWQRDETYDSRKQARSQSLYRAVERVIPDLRDRLVLELIGTPLTHARFLRRYQGSYGPAIAASLGKFPSCHTPIQGLFRVGDSTLPGIGVPAVAASGILCANTLVSPAQTHKLISSLGIAKTFERLR